MLGSRRVTGSEYVEVEHELDLECLEQVYRDTAEEFGMEFELDERGDEVVYVLRDPPEGLKERLWKGLEARLEMRVDKTEDYNIWNWMIQVTLQVSDLWKIYVLI